MSETVKKEKVEPRLFNLDYLHQLLERDGAIMVGEYPSIRRMDMITILCACKKETEKRFADIAYYGGAFCKSCCAKNKERKKKETCMQIYGVSNPSQSNEIKKKKEDTYMEHYGMHPRKTEEVKAKYRKTCMEKYHVDNTAKVQEVKDKIKKTFDENYGGHPMYDATIKEKVKETCLERYGGYPAQSQVVVDKMVDTFMKNYGCFPTQDPVIKQKIIDTNMERYGCHSTQTEDVKNKIIATNLERYGVKYAVEHPDIKNKIIATNLERYGVRNPQQNTEIQEKTQRNAKKFKEYRMPSGEIRKVQGYEPFALDILVKEYTEDQIKSNREDVPRITYEYENKSRYYFPDLYIPHKNLIVEVKSTWTCQKEVEKNTAKGNATINKGYNYEMWIFNAKGIRIESPNTPS
jgi:hypothetical protein